MDADSPPQELLEVLLVDLGGLKLVERGGEIGLALSVSRDGLADVMQYARANPDALVVGDAARETRSARPEPSFKFSGSSVCQAGPRR